MMRPMEEMGLGRGCDLGKRCVSEGKNRAEEDVFPRMEEKR